MKKWICAILVLALCAAAALSEGARLEPTHSGDAAVAAPDAVRESLAPSSRPTLPPAAGAAEVRASAVPQRPADPSVDVPQDKEEVCPEAGAEDLAEAASPTEGADAAEGEAPGVAQGDAEAGETPAPGEQQDAQGQGDAQAEGEAPTAEPGENTPSPEASAGDPAVAPTATGIDPGAPEADPAAPEAYALVGEKQERKEGTLAELLATPGEKTVYLLVAQIEAIPEFPLANLKDVTLLPDPQAFPGERYAVQLLNGEVEITPEAIEAAVDERVTLLASVVELPPEEPVDPSAIKLTVTPRNYTPGAWMNWSPEFVLSGIPMGSEGYSYWAMIYDERFFPLTGDSYLPQDEGVYTLRFAIMNPQGDVVSTSAAYEVKLDFTPPELNLDVSEIYDYTMTLSATDAPGGAAAEASGVVEYSLDGGTTWMPLGDGESIMHTESQRRTFPPNAILVRDLAGNIAGNAGDVVLDRLPSFGGGGGGPTATPGVPHASGDGDDAPYASYELALPEGEVSELTLGGEPIDLRLDVDGEGPANFSAELTAWTPDSDAFFAEETSGAPEPAEDTLVVRAEPNGTHSYVWRINGSVLRKLYNSDIRYLALCADGAMLSLPTVGFTAGTKYAELKMGGVSTAEFVYEISMRTGSEPPAEDWNWSADCAVEIAVSVSGERYVMLDRSATPEMYSYDVYCGPEDLPDYPYGKYPGLEGEPAESEDEYSELETEG